MALMRDWTVYRWLLLDFRFKHSDRRKANPRVRLRRGSFSRATSLAVILTSACAFVGTESVRAADQWAWTADHWSMNDVRWRRFRLQIEGMVSKTSPQFLSQRLQQMIATREKTLAAKPRDADAMFEWMTIAFQLRHYRISRGYRVRMRPLADADVSHSFDNLATSYEFTRARCLLTAPIGPQKPLFDLSKRLLAKDPSDLGAKEALAASCDARSMEEVKLGKRYSDELAAKRPSEAEPWYYVGYNYYQAWCVSYSGLPSDRKRAMAAFEKYLKLNPQFSPQRAFAEEYLRRLKRNSKA
jgi:hypothetical protein